MSVRVQEQGQLLSGSLVKYVWFMAVGLRGDHLLLLCRAAVCVSNSRRINLNTPCLLATHGSTSYI